MTNTDYTDYTLVQRFNEIVGHHAPHPSDMQTVDRDNPQHLLRFKLIQEEFNELAEAFSTNNTVGYADALIDLVVVIFGDIHTKGWDYRPMLEEVMRANFSKLDDDGQPIYREDGKVLKGPHYSAPDLSPYLPPTTTPVGS